MLKVEHYQLDLVGFPLGTASALDPDSWSWTLFISGVAQGVRHQSCVGILTSVLIKVYMTPQHPY